MTRDNKPTFSRPTEELVHLRIFDTFYLPTKMCASTLICTFLVLMMAGLNAISDGSQGNKQVDTRYSRGADCRFIYRSLKYVCPQGSGITAIPAPCCIPQVRYLELVGNSVTSLRKREFSKRLSNLHGMDLRNNQISRIHQGAFHGLRRLQVLDLSGNRLTTLHAGVFKGLTSLTTLNLGGNGMVSLKQGGFSGLPSLNVLRLDNNNLREIREEAFEPLEELVNLYLDRNQLITLHSRSFSGLRRLRALSLASNRLQTIPYFLGELPELLQLVMNDNPLACDCRVESLRRWLVEHGSGPAEHYVQCASPERFRGQQLGSIPSWFLCQPEKHPGETSHGVPRFDQFFASTTSSPHRGHGASIPGGISFSERGETFHSVIADLSPDVNSTPTPKPATTRERTDRVFFEVIPESDHGIPPPPTTPSKKPEIPLRPGHEPPNVDPEHPGSATPKPRPGYPPDAPGGKPGVNDPHRPGYGLTPKPAGPGSGPDSSLPDPSRQPLPNNPQGPTSGHGLTTQGSSHSGSPDLDLGGNPVYPGQPTVVPGGPSAPPDNPNETSTDVLGAGATMPPIQLDPDGPGQSYDSEILTTPEAWTGSASIAAGGPSGDVEAAAGGSSSSAESPNSPLVIYGVDGQSVVLLCGIDELVSKPRVKWLKPNGKPITGVNSRFKLEEDGSLRIYPLKRSDTGSYRCIVRQMQSSRVILVRLRAACPCTGAASFEEHLSNDSSPEPYPVNPYACSWTPLVIAVVTTFQGTVAACAVAFCVWYTRCHRKKTFTIRVEEAEKRDSMKLRNSDMSVLRRCSNSTITSSPISSSLTSYEQGSLHPCDTLNAGSRRRSSHPLTDYMNAYMTQHMPRQYQLQLPVPDYVDLDENSRDHNETLYSSLRGRNFSNRRKRIVTQ